MDRQKITEYTDRINLPILQEALEDWQEWEWDEDVLISPTGETYLGLCHYFDYKYKVHNMFEFLKQNYKDYFDGSYNYFSPDTKETRVKALKEMIKIEKQ